MEEARKMFIRKLWGKLEEFMAEGKEFVVSVDGGYGSISGRCMCTDGNCYLIGDEIEFTSEGGMEANIKTDMFDSFSIDKGIDNEYLFVMADTGRSIAVSLIFA